MEPGPVRDVLTVAVGVVTGGFSAAFGIGGAVISTPGIRVLGASALISVGTTLPSILPSAAAGTARYWREGLVDWGVVAVTAPAGAVTAVAGSLASERVPGEGHWLMVATAALLAFTAVRVGLGRKEGARPAAEAESAENDGQRHGQRRESVALRVGIGVAAGLLSGLLGVGGGAVMLPGFVEVLRLPTKVAVASSLACVGILAVPGTVTHAALGNIDWRLAGFLTLGVIPGARLGAAITVKAQDRRLQLAVAAVMGALAVGYGFSEIRSALR
jgi:uncharacterized membrane protein YfcA